MKLNKIDEVWTNANSLFKWRFWFVVIQKFCYHGNVTWRLLLSLKEPTASPKQSHGAIRHLPSLGENWSSSGQFWFNTEWTKHLKFAICSDPSFTLQVKALRFPAFQGDAYAPKKYRAFSHEATVALLVFQNNKTAAMLVFQTNPLGVERSLLFQ